MSSNKRPSKILFCRFKDPFVQELATWDPKQEQLAMHAVKTLNNTIVCPNGDFEDEFWFLNKRIKGETKIVVLSSHKEYPNNDPEIVAKLEDYLRHQEDNGGSFQNRSVPFGLDLETHNQLELQQTELLYKTNSHEKAKFIHDKLNEKFVNQITCVMGVQGGRAYIKVTSLQLTRQVILDYIDSIKPGS